MSSRVHAPRNFSVPMCANGINHLYQEHEGDVQNCMMK